MTLTTDLMCVYEYTYIYSVEWQGILFASKNFLIPFLS